MLKIQTLPLGPLQTNCFLAICDVSRKAAVIDPAWDGDAIARLVSEGGWVVTHILLTHTHFDHVGGLAALHASTGAPIFVHEDAIPMLKVAASSAARWGLHVDAPPEADYFLEEGQTIAVGEVELKVLFTPGHAPGHVSFYAPKYQALFDGDVLFENSIGRTDLPGGDYATLLATIRDKLLALPDQTNVFPGHGNPTTIGRERRMNPFLRDAS